MKYTFHLLGLTHLPVSDKYSGCAYTQKNFKLAKMLMSAGHTVYLYGVEGSNAPCSEFIQISSLSDLQEVYGEGVDNELGYDYKKNFFKQNFNEPYNKQTLAFFDKAVEEINKRKKPDDFLLCTAGYQQKTIADRVGLFLTCEPGIGYTGVFSRFKAFESSFQQNYIYGWQNQASGSANGNNYDVVVPNYFDTNDFTFHAKPDKDPYFLFIGRMIVKKGILNAVETCKRIGAKLVLAGQGGYVKDGYLYGDGFSVPYENMEYIGFLDKERRTELMGGAQGVFVPTDYLEPFGGVSIESLLSGTPVITTNYGCFPETIPHGKVGYRCQTLDQFVWAAKNIWRISRFECREYAVENFSLERVNEMYEEWWNMLYHLYLSTDPAKKDIEGWYFIDPERHDLDWLNKY